MAGQVGRAVRMAVEEMAATPGRSEVESYSRPEAAGGPVHGNTGMEGQAATSWVGTTIHGRR